MQRPQPHPGQCKHPSFSSTKELHSGQFLIVSFVIGLSDFWLPLSAYINPLPDSFTAFAGCGADLASCLCSADLALGATRTWSLMLESLNTVTSLHPSL